MSVFINIYFFVRVFNENRESKSKKSRDVDGSVNTPEPSKSVENVKPNGNDQELNRIDVESAVVKQEITNEQDEMR